MNEIEITPRERLVRCARCQQLKAADGFKMRSGRTTRDTYCRPCRTTYQHEHYVANRQRYIENAGKRRRAATVERMSYLLTFFETHPCVDCHEDDSSVLEFDHLENKAFNISQGFRDRAWSDVLAEIDKCVVRCANCHRRRTAETRGWYRALMLGDSADSADSAVNVPFTTPGGKSVEPSK